MDSASSVGLGSVPGTPRLDTDMGSYSQDRSGGAETPAAPAPSGRARPSTIPKLDDIPIVTDETGERVRESFAAFLERYMGDRPSSPDSIYVEQLYAMRDYGRTTLYVDFAHVLDHDEVLARAITEQYYRFLPYLRRALIECISVYIPGYLYLNAHMASTASSGLVTRDFSVSFHHLPLQSGIRSLRSDKIGRLLCVNGTVTRTSEVRPELILGTFTCVECKTSIPDVEQQFRYTEPLMCLNPMCQNRTQWELDVEKSRFCDWQKVRIQENANQIPTGSMPRSLDVILRSEIVERAKAGDRCEFTGTFIVLPDVSQLGVPGVNAQIQRQTQFGLSLIHI